MKKRAYLAGPMHSRPDFNFPLFDHVAARLGGQYDVFNPAQHARKVYGSLQRLKTMTPEQLDVARRGLMAFELHWICVKAELMFMLPGWEQSIGAYAEHEVAVACKLEIRPVPDIILPEKQYERS